LKDSYTVPSKVEVTQLFKAWGQGDDGALAKLITLVQNELHRRARRYMSREKPGHALQTTALVNEVYLRLVDMPQMSWQDCTHFFAMMRRILTDFCPVSQLPEAGWYRAACVLRRSPGRVSRAGCRDSGNRRCVEPARCSGFTKKPSHGAPVFFGLSAAEIAEVLKVSPETVKRNWRFAKSWLHRVLSGEKDDETGAFAAS